MESRWQWQNMPVCTQNKKRKDKSALTILLCNASTAGIGQNALFQQRNIITTTKRMKPPGEWRQSISYECSVAVHVDPAVYFRRSLWCALVLRGIKKHTTIIYRHSKYRDVLIYSAVTILWCSDKQSSKIVQDVQLMHRNCASLELYSQNLFCCPLILCTFYVAFCYVMYCRFRAGCFNKTQARTYLFEYLLKCRLTCLPHQHKLSYTSCKCVQNCNQACHWLTVITWPISLNRFLYFSGLASCMRFINIFQQYIRTHNNVSHITA